MEREGESGELEIDGEKMRILISSLLGGGIPAFQSQMTSLSLTP